MKAGFALSNEQIARWAPSVFASQAAARTSSKYELVPTIRVVDGLRANGWFPVSVTQSRVRDEGRAGFQKHMLRFRHADHMNLYKVGDECPEVVIVNSHDGSSSYQLNAGWFRLVCSNGMVVPTGENAGQRLRHSGDVVQNVIEGVFEIVPELGRVAEQVEEFKQITLQPRESRAMAIAAMGLRWDEPENSGFTPEQVLQPRRVADTNNDLWTVTNRIQESLTRGGMLGRKLNDEGKWRSTTAREVKGIDNLVGLNKAIWTLASEMAKLKA